MMGKIIVLLLIIGITVWWLKPPAGAAFQVGGDGLLPTADTVAFVPSLGVEQQPLQENLRQRRTLLTADGYEFVLVARFEVAARVLSRRDYRSGREAQLSPTDLALGWGAMAQPEVLAQLRIRQSNRRFYWQTDHFPIPRRDIERHSANMHLIPANAMVTEQLRQPRAHDVVHFTGYLVNVRHHDGWYWNSSTTRNDVGHGACELVLVSSLRVAKPTAAHSAVVEDR